MSEVLIRAENVGKKFCRDLKKSLWYGVKDSAAELFCREQASKLRDQEFWANQGISFSVSRGECLALIGHNGAGKTTLLKVISGLIKPDEGRVSIRGQVNSLIALGAGFNPILTARENIYVNGAILGLSSKKVNLRIEEIVEFSGLNDFIDSPVRTLSSGMNVRLGFATAVLLIKPDVLLVDEVLSVGDASFRVKSMNAIHNLLETAAVVFVSHNEQLVRRACTTALFLEQGKLLHRGSVGEVYEAYHEVYERNLNAPSSMHTIQSIRLTKVSIDEKIEAGDSLTVQLEFDSEKSISDVYIRIAIHSADHIMIAEYNSTHYNEYFAITKGLNRISQVIESTKLSPGVYCVSVLMHPASDPRFLIWLDKSHKLRVTGQINSNAPIML
ncbi:Teichoic acids export ATP-binding protein TagH [Novipirellula galeiformis]|uniref:Teichoic acids export ATP-binding protein TagH n=1 Tax=Novipirellula galeiformis TaxID=2528004 RepID=A0A5C6CAV7_9BACT|nr:ABC transporter ATP-binding protein [Novipirellula galeiformis]TWU21222.1 Teichoic acids export ATP-binding protein TagH [Novipirellula galeiformis]